MTDVPPSGGHHRSFLKPDDRPAPEPRRPDGPAGATIVVCNPDPTLLQLFAEIFEGEAYDPIACREGDRALQVVRAARPALAILDLRMGGVSARQVLDAMRADAALASIPVLVCSVDPPEIDAAGAWARELGCELLLMPFNIDDLLEKVARLARPRRPVAGGSLA